MDEITLLVVDDEPLLVQALCIIVGQSPDFRVIGTASNGQDAVNVYFDLLPDVVLMDLVMPRLTGVEAIARIVEKDPAARILTMTSMSSEDSLIPSLVAGASGYLTKDATAEAILDAVRRVHGGEMALSPEATHHLVHTLVTESAPHQPSATRHEPPGPPLPISLTPRELTILGELAVGRSNTEIAERLFLSESTVKSNLGRIMVKLGTDNRVQTLVRAVQWGLVEIPGEGAAEAAPQGRPR